MNNSFKTTKQKEALQRNTAWASLTHIQQLKSLDDRGMVAKSQRARIAKKLK